MLALVSAVLVFAVATLLAALVGGAIYRLLERLFWR